MANGFFGRLGPVLQGAGASLASTGDLTQIGATIPRFQAIQQREQALAGQQQLRDLQTQAAQQRLADAERERQQEAATAEAFRALPPGIFGGGDRGAAIRAAGVANPALGQKLLLAQATRKPERPQVGRFKQDPATGRFFDTATGEFATPEQTPGIVQASEGGTPRRVIPIRDPVKKANVEGKLRGDFFQRSKGFLTQRDAFDRVGSIAALPTEELKTGAQDLGLIFSFMKVLDPGSVVRETEFANAQNAAGVPSRVRNAWNKLKTGQILTAGQRAEFLRTAKAAVAKAQKRHASRRQRFTGIAERSGVDPRNVVDEQAVAAPIQAAPTVANVPQQPGAAAAAEAPPFQQVPAGTDAATAAQVLGVPLKTATNPQTGERAALNPATGKWEPIQ